MQIFSASNLKQLVERDIIEILLVLILSLNIMYLRGIGRKDSNSVTNGEFCQLIRNMIVF